jgi:hypothetical protein
MAADTQLPVLPLTIVASGHRRLSGRVSCAGPERSLRSASAGTSSIAAIALREGRQAWRGEACGCCA